MIDIWSLNFGLWSLLPSFRDEQFSDTNYKDQSTTIDSIVHVGHA